MNSTSPSESAGAAFHEQRREPSRDTVLTRQTGVAKLQFGDELVLAYEGSGRVILLETVAAAMWAMLDGSCTLGDLASDLESVTGAPADRCWDRVSWFGRAMAADGFLVDPALDRPLTPRRVYPVVERDSCLGKRMGLGRAQVLRLKGGDGYSLRVGSTMPGLLEKIILGLGPKVHQADPVDLPVDMVMGRVVEGRTPRTQWLLGPLGDPLYVGRDFVEACEATGRTVAARLESQVDGSTWIDGPVLLIDEQAVVIHPAYHLALTGPLRSDVAAMGWRWAPSGQFRLVISADAEGQPMLVASADPATSAPPLRWPVAGVVGPTVASTAEAIRAVAHVAWRWDDAHLADVARLLKSAPIVQIPREASGRATIERIALLG